MPKHNSSQRQESCGPKRVPARAKLGLPSGETGAVSFFDNQPNEPVPAIQLLTIAEAARFLKISKSGVRRLQQGRHIPFFKVGGSIRFAKDDLMSYLARRRVSSIGQ
jgi:excisionase family DNA binding protein